MSSTFIVTKTGVYACGCNSGFRLGLGNTDLINKLTRVNIENVIQVVHSVDGPTMFVTFEGEVYAVGSGKYTHPKMQNMSVPTKLDIPLVLSICTGNPTIFNTIDGIYIWHDFDYGFMNIYAGPPTKFTIPDLEVISVHPDKYGAMVNTNKELYYYCLFDKEWMCSTATEIHHFDHHTIAKTAFGVYVWGDNSSGHLGIEEEMDTIDYPMLLDIPEVLFMGCARDDTVFVTVSGVYVCGKNTHKKFPFGPCDIRTPKLVDLPEVTKVHNNETYVAYETVAGIYVFGSIEWIFNSPNIVNVIPMRSYIVVHTETHVHINGKLNDVKIDKVFDLHPILDIITGTQNVVLLSPEGCYGIGDNTHGQLGLGHFGSVADFTKIPDFNYEPVMSKRFGTTKRADVAARTAENPSRSLANKK